MSTIYYTHFNEQIRRSGVRFGHVFAQGFENATTADTCLVRWSHLREMLFQTKTAFPFVVASTGSLILFTVSVQHVFHTLSKSCK